MVPLGSLLRWRLPEVARCAGYLNIVGGQVAAGNYSSNRKALIWSGFV